MEQYFLFVVVLLFILAASDLIVGVSNDAVNFLNSAVGSKVAPRHVIMIVASLGIFIGATFSSGMMEVARKGIFHPDQFYFIEIMSIFLAVMLTDIILLDLFNTFGLPTSTTVSIVFELLGAAVIVSLIKMDGNGESFTLMGNYINATKAGEIILGIFLSVVFAFALGAILQYLSRIIFSFEYERRLKSLGGVWSGFALSALTYFLLFKGVKGASFVSEAQITWIQNNTLALLGISFVVWSVIMTVLANFRINILRFIVLFGTFSLAMSFASNDLVNFIGVPIAGFESFNFWVGSGEPVDTFTMEALRQPVRTPTPFLLGAGLIMVVTLWLSKKARSVTETEVNLARQDEGLERFQPNALARGIIRVSTFVSNKLSRFFPAVPGNGSPQTTLKMRDKPAFDLVRASVNLTMASILISFATSLKLPLSTTYVSFMVAMGSSLADKAWDRDSAVYRVSGVLNVIGGWFMTAAIAFTVSGTFAFLILNYELPAVLVITGIAVALIIHGVFTHRRREKDKEEQLDMIDRITERTTQEALEDSRINFIRILREVQKIYDLTINGLVQEDRKILAKARDSFLSYKKHNKKYRNSIIAHLKHIKEDGNEGAKLFLKVYGIQQDTLQSIGLIFDTVYNHVENMHNPIMPEQGQRFLELNQEIGKFFNHYTSLLEHDRDQEEVVEYDLSQLIETIDTIMNQQLEGIKKDTFSSRNSRLIISLTLETRDLINSILKEGKRLGFPRLKI